MTVIKYQAYPGQLLYVMLFTTSGLYLNKTLRRFETLQPSSISSYVTPLTEPHKGQYEVTIDTTSFALGEYFYNIKRQSAPLKTFPTISPVSASITSDSTVQFSVVGLTNGLTVTSWDVTGSGATINNSGLATFVSDSDSIIINAHLSDGSILHEMAFPSQHTDDDNSTQVLPYAPYDLNDTLLGSGTINVTPTSYIAPESYVQGSVLYGSSQPKARVSVYHHDTNTYDTRNPAYPRYQIRDYAQVVATELNIPFKEKPISPAPAYDYATVIPSFTGDNYITSSPRIVLDVYQDGSFLPIFNTQNDAWVVGSDIPYDASFLSEAQTLLPLFYPGTEITVTHPTTKVAKLPDNLIVQGNTSIRLANDSIVYP